MISATGLLDVGHEPSTLPWLNKRFIDRDASSSEEPILSATRGATTKEGLQQAHRKEDGPEQLHRCTEAAGERVGDEAMDHEAAGQRIEREQV